MKFTLEYCRSRIQKIFKTDSFIYGLGHKTLDFGISILSGQGGTYLKLKSFNITSNNNKLVRIKCKNLKFPLNIRPGTMDSEIIISNIIREEYGYIKLQGHAVRWIIDGGGYIGDTAAYFLNIYPESKVISLEPDIRNFEILKLNLRYYKERAHCINKALFGDNTKMMISGNSDTDSTGGFVSEESENENNMSVECVSIPSLIDEYKIDSIDILKLDIEGAEGSVLNKSSNHWLSLIKMIIIEIHSEALLLSISKVMQENEFKMFQYRSLWYCVNSREKK